ncbi:MAG: ATP-grasp domain-containing protein, partial [Kiloniellales bacterium]
MIAVPTARYAEVIGPESLARVAHDLGRPCVLKTAELGYDGKGQVLVGPETDADRAWAEMLAQAGAPSSRSESGEPV